MSHSPRLPFLTTKREMREFAAGQWLGHPTSVLTVVVRIPSVKQGSGCAIFVGSGITICYALEIRDQYLGYGRLNKK